MSQDILEIELEEAGYYGGYWFDSGGEYAVEDTWRMRRDIEEDPEATILNEFTGELPSGRYKSLESESLDAQSLETDEKYIGMTKHISTGRDLGQEIRDALDAGYRTIVVHQTEGGGGWDWSTDITVDAISLGGVEISLDRNVVVTYTGSGIPLHVSNTWDVVESTNAQFELTGGLWRASGNPDGWIRVDDAYGTRLNPQEVDFRNDSGDCVGIELRNVDGFSEDAHISGRVKADIGFRTTPASVTGGSGTGSFHDTHVTHLWINASNIGYHLRGNLLNTTFVQPTMQPIEDGAVGWKLETSQAEGMTIISPKVEDAGNTQTGCTAFQTTSNFNGANPPFILNETVHFFDTKFDKNDGFSDSFVSIRSQENRLEIGEPGGGGNVYYYPRASQFVGDNMNLKTYSGRMSINGGDGVVLKNSDTTLLQAIFDKVFMQAPVKWSPRDVRNFNGTNPGVMAYHDGSGSNTEGPAYWNESSSEWVSLVDGTTIS